MLMLQFEWDESKNQENIKKHGISFKEAISVFDDDDALTIYDALHSETEDRFLLIGFSAKQNLLVVCHCYRLNVTVVIIISARKATKTEENNMYEVDGETYLEAADFKNAKKNKCSKKLKKQITINVSLKVLEYFKSMSIKSEIPYQTLINSYLLDCAINDKLKIPWLEE